VSTRFPAAAVLDQELPEFESVLYCLSRKDPLTAPVPALA